MVTGKQFLTAQDRCDWPRCDARAFARVFFETEGDPSSLDACGHHFHEAYDRLVMTSMYHIDETDFILGSD